MKKLLLLMAVSLTLSGCSVGYELPDLETKSNEFEDVIQENILEESIIEENVIVEETRSSLEDAFNSIIDSSSEEFESYYIRDNILDLEMVPDSIGAVTLGQSGPRIIAYSNSDKFVIGKIDVFYETYDNKYEVLTVSDTELTEWLTLDVNISDYAVIGVVVYDINGLLLGWGYQQIVVVG
jgi:hypothetical protein